MIWFPYIKEKFKDEAAANALSSEKKSRWNGFKEDSLSPVLVATVEQSCQSQ
jgi:hypothetical protein